MPPRPFGWYAIVAEFVSFGIPVLLASFEPPAFLGKMALTYSGTYERGAARYSVSIHPFVPPGMLGDRARVFHDQLDPNALAIDKVAAAMPPVLEGPLDLTKHAARS